MRQDFEGIEDPENVWVSKWGGPQDTLNPAYGFQLQRKSDIFLAYQDGNILLEEMLEGYQNSATEMAICSLEQGDWEHGLGMDRPADCDWDTPLVVVDVLPNVLVSALRSPVPGHDQCSAGVKRSAGSGAGDILRCFGVFMRSWAPVTCPSSTQDPLHFLWISDSQSIPLPNYCLTTGSFTKSL